MTTKNIMPKPKRKAKTTPKWTPNALSKVLEDIGRGDLRSPRS